MAKCETCGRDDWAAEAVEAAMEARALVDRQAENVTLWIGPVAEWYVRKALRELHAAVEAIPLGAGE